MIDLIELLMNHDMLRDMQDKLNIEKKIDSNLWDALQRTIEIYTDKINLEIEDYKKQA